MRIFILIVLLSGCSIGPIHVTHKEGSLPKLRIDTGYEACKVRAKARGEANIECEWEY